jgi:hypothetical protein
MQQRRVRLGDILDDYCPRERRITNHAVVAMIEDEVKQTRCTTCDAEHEYKQAKVPATRRKKPTGALAGSADTPALGPPPQESSDAGAPETAAAGDAVEESFDTPIEPFVNSSEPPSLEASPPDPDAGQPEADEQTGAPEDEWPVHRPLIRATLPRPEGQVPERKEPDFTIRNNRFDRNANRQRGDRHGRGPGSHSRFNQSPSGSGPSHRSGHGQGAGQHSGHGSRPGNRPPSGQRGGGRPSGGQGRGPNAGHGRGRRGR